MAGSAFPRPSSLAAPELFYPPALCPPASGCPPGTPTSVCPRPLAATFGSVACPPGLGVLPRPGMSECWASRREGGGWGRCGEGTPRQLRGSSELLSPGGQRPRAFLMVPKALHRPALSSAPPVSLGRGRGALRPLRPAPFFPVRATTSHLRTGVGSAEPQPVSCPVRTPTVTPSCQAGTALPRGAAEEGGRGRSETPSAAVPPHPCPIYQGPIRC